MLYILKSTNMVGREIKFTPDRPKFFQMLLIVYCTCVNPQADLAGVALSFAWINTNVSPK